MATGIDQEKYYDNYWTTGISQHSGENTGYAPNLKRWMDRELKEILKGGNEISLLLPLRYIQIESTSVAAEV